MAWRWTLVLSLLLAPVVRADESPIVVGQQAPWIAALDLDGNPVALGQLLAKHGTRGAVVQFWASWCESCRAELKELAASQAKLADAGIAVMLVDILDEPEAVAKVVKELGLERLPLARDANGSVASRVGLVGKSSKDLSLPLTIAVNAKNEVKLILREAQKDYLKQLLEALASEPARGVEPKK
jgi:peroxiredoxin